MKRGQLKQCESKPLLHAASSMLTGHSVQRLQSAVSGRVWDFVTVRPSGIIADALGDTLVHIASSVLVADDVGASCDWKLTNTLHTWRTVLAYILLFSYWIPTFAVVSSESRSAVTQLGVVSSWWDAASSVLTASCVAHSDVARRGCSTSLRVPFSTGASVFLA